jgi:hypothetical protein
MYCMTVHTRVSVSLSRITRVVRNRRQRPWWLYPDRRIANRIQL